MHGTNANEKNISDLLSLEKPMDKYDFNRPYKVSVSIIESDDEVQPPKLHVDNGEKRLNPVNVNEADRTSSIYFQNAHKRQRLHNDTEKTNGNNASILPEIIDNTATQNNYQNNTINSSISELQLPQSQSYPRPTAVYGDFTSSCIANKPQMREIANELDMLSNNIIKILKAYTYYINCYASCGNNELLRENCNKKYLFIKEQYFRASCDIIARNILPRDKSFNETQFLHRTVHIAKHQEIFFCTYKNVNTIFNEIMNSCCNKFSYHKAVPVSHVPTKIINNKHNLLLQKDLQNDGHNMAQTINNQQNPILQQNSQDNKLNNANRHSSNLLEPMDNRTTSALQTILQNAEHNNNIKQAVNTGPRPIFQPNYKNNPPINNRTQKNYKAPNETYQRNLQNDGNYNNHQQNCSDQRLLEDPTTCLFQYRCPDYEVRLDVETQLLNEVNRQSYNPSYTEEQNNSDNVRNPIQPIECLNASTNQMPSQDDSQIPKEPIRSTSRDSGFMSPFNNQISDACNNGEGQDSNSPYITHITSLNPGATHIPQGSCYVCGKLTKKMCIGCFKTYYCSNDCQNQHWSTHQFDCSNER